MRCQVLSLCFVVAALLVMGCERHDRAETPRMSERELLTRSQLDSYPPAVKTAFVRDYPDAAVTSVDVYNDATGRLLYQVNYVRGGRAGSAAYNSEGLLVTAPGPRAAPPQQQPAPAASPPAPPAPPPPPQPR